MNKILMFWTKVLRLTPTKDSSPKRQSFIHFSKVYIIYKSIYNCFCRNTNAASHLLLLA